MVVADIFGVFAVEVVVVVAMLRLGVAVLRCWKARRRWCPCGSA